MEGPADWIRDARTQLGISTRDLARLSGISYPTISRIEQGHEQPRWDTLERLLEVLGRSLRAEQGFEPVRLADLTGAWSADALGTHHPDWTRFRALADQLTRRPALTAMAINPEPGRSDSPLIDALLAAVAEKLADDAGIARPVWTRSRAALAEPWSSVGRARRRAESGGDIPLPFEARNLMIPASTIWRERHQVVA